MKSFALLTALCFVLLMTVQSCLTCTRCERNDLEAKCIKATDTLIFNQDGTPGQYEIHEYYSGGDSIFYLAVGRFENVRQRLADSGYTCSVYPTGNVSKAKLCNEAGEEDDDRYYSFYHVKAGYGYTCEEYKGH